MGDNQDTKSVRSESSSQKSAKLWMENQRSKCSCLIGLEVGDTAANSTLEVAGLRSVVSERMRIFGDFSYDRCAVVLSVGRLFGSARSCHTLMASSD